MAKSKTGKSSDKSGDRRDPVAENGSKVVKGGVYDGSQPSKDFVVSGHSTGNPDSEMEALSHQVSRDAGEVPAYPTNDNFRDQKPRADFGAELQTQKSRSFPEISLWSSLSMVGVGLLGFVAYKMYKNPELRKSMIPAM